MITASRENSSTSLRNIPTSKPSNSANAASSATPPEVSEVIDSVKRIANNLRANAEDQKKLKAIKGNEELLHRINEVMVEIDLQSSKIVAAIKINKNVLQDLTMLKDVMEEIQEFFVAVQKAFMFMSKTKLKLRMQNLYQSLRARLTQVMAAVSLALLTEKPVKEPTPKVSSEIYRIGLSYYYGINGKPMNYTFAFEKFVQAAEYGDEDAMIFAATCYLKGHGVEEHYDSGLHWLGRAAISGRCPQAKTEIAKLIIEQVKSENPDAILDSLNPTSQHENVMKTPKTRSSGQSLRASSATSRFSVVSGESGGDQQSTYRDEDEDGMGGQEEQDIQHAMKLLLEAATEGHVEAKTVLGTVYEEAGDLEQAAKWYSLASNGGSAKGTYHLGQLFLQGHGSMVVNRHKAYSLFAMAAKNGQMEAWNGMGLCYESGVGIDQNVSLAVNYYRKGAQAGHIHAMYNLGYVLVKNAIEILDNMKKVKIIASHVHHLRYGDRGEEILEDELPPEQSEVYLDMGKKTEQALEEGIHWLRAAAENKIPDASFQLGRLYEQAIGVPLDTHAALAHYRRAADAKHAKAAFYAANLLYARGGTAGDGGHDGFDRDLVEAAKYYAQAATAGIAEAMNAYALLLEDGRATPDGLKDPYAAATWYYEACIHDYADAFLNLALMLATDPIHSFTTVKGDIVTLGQITKFLDTQLPLEMDRDKLDTFQSLIQQVYAKTQQPSHQHHTTGVGGGGGGAPLLARRYAASDGAAVGASMTTSSRPRSDSGDQHSVHSQSSGRPMGRGGGSSESKYDGRGSSMVLVDPYHGEVQQQPQSLAGDDRYQTGISEMTNVPSLQRASRRGIGSAANDAASVVSTSVSSLPGTIAAERASRRVARGDLLPPRGRTAPAYANDASTTQDYDDHHDAAGYHHHSSSSSARHPPQRVVSMNISTGASQPMKRVIFDAQTSKSLSALSITHDPVDGSSTTAAPSVHRAGEMFVTNGAIPPPNYVPRATMSPAPSSASKPAPSKTKTAQTVLSSSAFPPSAAQTALDTSSASLLPPPTQTDTPVYKPHSSASSSSAAAAAPYGSNPGSPSRSSDPPATLKFSYREAMARNQSQSAVMSDPALQRHQSTSSMASTHSAAGATTAAGGGGETKKTASVRSAPLPILHVSLMISLYVYVYRCGNDSFEVAGTTRGIHRQRLWTLVVPQDRPSEAVELLVCRRPCPV